MDFKPTLQNVVYVTEANVSTTPVLNLNNTPMITVRKQTYNHEPSGTSNAAHSLIVYKDAEVDQNDKIVWVNGSNQSKSTIYQKNIRHAKVLKQFLSSHKKGDEKYIQIFDNDLDRNASGSQTWQFNKGLPSEQHTALQKEGVEYLLIQNAKKPRQQSNQPPTHVLIGGKDMEILIRLVSELEAFYEGIENISTNADHSNRIVDALLSEAQMRKARTSTKVHKISKKRKIVESEDEIAIQDDDADGDIST